MICSICTSYTIFLVPSVCVRSSLTDLRLSKSHDQLGSGFARIEAANNIR